MLEKKFRSNFIAELKKIGKEAFPIESATSPGFPDVVVAGFTISLFELKVVMTRASKTTVHDICEPTQRTFQRRWWTTQAAGLWLALYDEHDDVYQALQLAPLLLDKQLCAITSYGITGRGVAELVKNMKGVL